MKKLIMLVLFVGAIVESFAVPTVSNLKVTPLPPWGLVIDYDLDDVVGEYTNSLPVVTASANGMTNVAYTLVGDTACVKGSHRVYWNMAADGITAKMNNAIVSVRYDWLYCVIDLSAGADATNYSVTYCDAPPAKGWTNEVYKTTKLVLKRVEAGSFIMGEDQTDKSHRVTLTKPFYMGLFEVTQKQWELVTGANPCSETEYGKGDAYPVHCVSYNTIRGSSKGANWPTSNAVDSDSFLGKLRAKTGNLLFDLPTEAQWEYACRAGTTTTYSYGDIANGDYMWYTSNSSRKTHEVGTKLSNKWGFYDMHGNVEEWCLDRYGTLAYGTDPKGSPSGSRQVERGGCWYFAASYCDSSHRDNFDSSFNNEFLGFRLSRTLLAAAGQAEADGAASVSGVNVEVRADGSVVDGELSVAYLPQRSMNAVVTAGDVKLIRAANAGAMMWQPLLSDVPQTLTHTVGKVSLSATYTWTDLEKGFAITYENLKGARHSNPAQYRQGVEYTFSDPLPKTGYTFTGWIPSAITADIASNVTVTANWQPNRYQIVYDANGGEGSTTTDCLYDERVMLTAKGVSREGYALLGWATSANGPLVYESGVDVANLTAEDDGEVVLYAVWKIIPPRVSHLNVTPLPPWGLVIDYDVNGAVGENMDCVLVVTASANGMTNIAQTLMGRTTSENGAHRLYWNMAADGITAQMTNVTVSVRYDWPVWPAYCVIDLSAGESATNYPIAYYSASPVEGWTNEVYKTTKLVLKRVESGSFIMGSDQTNEAHRVTLTRPFYMGLCEVTQKQWELVMGTNPSRFSGDVNPVEYISYDDIRGSSNGMNWPSSNVVDASSFLGRLRAKTGDLLFDLPTEAQWEYACRAGTTTTYSYGDAASDEYMWYKENSSYKTHEVGTKLPNRWGFYDMHGNVCEWCLDWYASSLSYGTDPKGSSSGSYRVERGGGWDDDASYCTSSHRDSGHPSISYYNFGFRLSRTLPAASGQAEAAGAAFVSGVNVDVLAEGSIVEGPIEIGYAPDGEQKAVVRINCLVAEFVHSSGSFLWSPSLPGTHVLSHAVGTNELTMMVTSSGDPVDGSCWTFAGDTNLTAVTLPNDMTVVPDEMFDGCSSLKFLEILAGVTNVGARAFRGMTSLTSLVVPEGVTNIGDGAFDGCMSLLSVNLPSTLADLGDNDFREMGARAGRSGLWIQDGWVMGYIGTAPAEVEIPDGVKGIAPYAFDDQALLEKVTFPTSLVSIGVNAFRRCTNLESIDLPEGLERVDDSAFQDCTYVKTLVTPSTLRRVGVAAFANTTSLGKVAFADGLDEIEEAAFSNDWRMLSVSIPVSVTNIGENAFWNCKNLTGVTVPTHLQPISSLFPAAYSNLTSIVIAEGETMLVTNVFAGCSSLESIVLPDAIDNIPESAFENCAALESLAIPSAVTNIGARALAGCSGIVRIEFPGALRSIGGEAFDGMALLEEVVLPAGLVGIGENAFADCEAIRSVTIPGGICSLASVFPSAYALLTSVTITTNTTLLADSFLDGCKSLPTIVIPASVTNIGVRALAGCSGVPELVFPECLQTIGAYACDGMSALTEVEIPAGVTMIGEAAFANCVAARRVTMPGGVCRVRDAFPTDYVNLLEVNVTPDTTRIVDGFFEGCNALTEVGVPNGVTEIGAGAFRDCAGLVRVALPDGLMVLPDESFAGCSALSSVVVPASVTSIGTKVFSGCASLKSVQFLGDAPTVATGAYDGVTSSLVTYVQTDSRGWDGVASSRSLPETWPGDASNAIATWTPTKIVVSFDAQGGEPAKTSLVNIVDTTYRLPQPSPTRKGATFAGWWSEVVAGAQVRPTTRVVLTSDHTFYAHWRFHEYEIAFDANGGDGEMASVARTVGDGEVALPSVSFRRTDFDFAGWATEPDGEIVFADGAVVGDLAYDDGAVVMLYAVWTARTWTTDDYLGVGADDGVAFGGAGEQSWTPDRETSHDGDGSMRSGTIGAADVGDTRETTMTATVVGEGMVSFWWKTSCEPADEEGTFFDYASFAVDGVTVAQIAGETDWTNVTHTITGAGEHVLAWTFTRDDYDEDETLYENAAWVDELTWERSSVVVSFDLGGLEGETPAAVTNVAGYALTLPDVSALGGAAKRFVGWSDGSSVYVAGATYLFGSADVTLTAQWEEKTWTLAEAVDVDAQLGFAFTTGGDAEWVVDFATNKVGEASARSGAITHSQTTWMETTVTGAGELRFWMKVCGERYRNKDCDIGTCSVDGVAVYTATTNDWTNVVVSVEGSGAHTIRWAYTKNASRTAVCDCAWVDGVTWTPSSVVPAVPSVLGDASATVTGDATSGWTVAPSEGVSSVEVTIPDGVDAAKVTVEVGADVAAVTPHGAKVKVVRGGHDITDYLDVPSADAAGSIDLTKAAVKEAVVKEAMDSSKGAKFEVKASEPTLTTSATKPGLTYTLREGTTLDGMSDGASKLGDGSPWTPAITVKGGASGFYSIKVTK